MNACERCFDDEVLVALIRECGRIGRCSWCKARGVHIFPLSELAEMFRGIADSYPENVEGGGQLIGDLLQGEWQIFSSRIVNRDLVQDMALEILNTGLRAKEAFEANYSGTFEVSRWFHSTLEESWHERVEEFFEGRSADTANASEPERPWDARAEENERTGLEDSIAFAISDLGLSYSPAEGQDLYRARIHTLRKRRDRFSAQEMGAPPAEKACAGRANRAEQRVLYVASDLETSIAEVRSWKGAVVAVAKLEITKEVRILDLRTPRYLDSPFFKENLQWSVETNELLRRFGEELSRPVMPHETETHYLPSQYLCDLVRNAGLDGVAYPSAMGSGYNLVILDPDAARIKEISYHRLRKVQFLSELIEEHEITIDDWPWSVQDVED